MLAKPALDTPPHNAPAWKEDDLLSSTVDHPGVGMRFAKLKPGNLAAAAAPSRGQLVVYLGRRRGLEPY